MKRLFKSLFLSFLGIFSLLSIGGLSFCSANSDNTFQGFGINPEKVKGVGALGTENAVNQETKLIDVIKKIISWTLGMLSLITVILLLYGGFNMLTATGDESKYKKGFTILKQAGVGLAFIALSWLIVSLIFYVITGSAKEAGVNSGGDGTAVRDHARPDNSSVEGVI